MYNSVMMTRMMRPAMDHNQHQPTNPRELSDTVVQAASLSRRSTRRLSSNLLKLNLADTQLHGRDGDIKLLKSKLHEFTKNVTEGSSNSDDATSAENKHRSEMLLVAGVSG